MQHLKHVLCVLSIALVCCGAKADSSIFAKGSLSRSYPNQDDQTQYTQSWSASGGLAIELFSSVTLEGRYTHINQFSNEVTVGSPTVQSFLNYSVQTAIYSAGLDIDLLGPKSWFQPFIYLGGGYLVNNRSLIVVDNLGGQTPIAVSDAGLSVNAGAGIRIKAGKSVAFEVEVFGYSKNIRDQSPTINLTGSAGIRFFL